MPPRVRYETSTGRPYEVFEELRRAVAQFVRGRTNFKIGRTSDPERRAGRPDYAAYDEMIVVYETRSIDHADEVEAELVASFPDADNDKGGGGGPEGHRPHFVYVMVVRWDQDQ